MAKRAQHPSVRSDFAPPPQRKGNGEPNREAIPGIILAIHICKAMTQPKKRKRQEGEPHE